MDDFDSFIKNKENTIKQQDAKIERISRSGKDANFMWRAYLVAFACFVSVDVGRFAVYSDDAYKEASQNLVENNLILPDSYIESRSLACVEDVYEAEFEQGMGKTFDDLSTYELTTVKSQNRESFERCAYSKIYSSEEEKEHYVRSLDYSLGMFTVPFIGGGLAFFGLSSYYGFRRRSVEAQKAANIQEMSLYK